jgi:hypothetical protein
MHPGISDEPGKARSADLRHRAHCGPRVRTARRAHSMPPRPARDDAQYQALFASALQPSGAGGAGVVAEAIRVTVQRLGTGGCAGWMAQEFGDHPEAAAERMRWARSLLSSA